MFDIFSRRAHRDAGKSPDAYSYDRLPEPLKVQVIHICNGVAGKFPEVFFHGGDAFYARVQQALCQEYGMQGLTRNARSAEEDVWEFFLQQTEVEKCLDVIEVVFACLVQAVRGDPYTHGGFGPELWQATDEINARFQQHAIGYEFSEGHFIRIDSGFLHKEAVAPAMVVLRERYLSGANQEFARAHDHLRHRRFGECINECLKAFESTMKAICHKRGWSYNQTDTAKKLLATCEQNGLFPPYMQSSLSGLRSVLESVPTTRNKLSGHGQGTQQIQITEETAAFVIHSTAANILFLAEREKQLP